MSRTFRNKNVAAGIPERYSSMEKKLAVEELTFNRRYVTSGRGYKQLEVKSKVYPEFMFPLLDFISSVKVTKEMVNFYPFEKPKRPAFYYKKPFYIFVPYVSEVVIDRAVKSWMFEHEESVYDFSTSSFRKIPNFVHTETGVWLNIEPLLAKEPQRDYTVDEQKEPHSLKKVIPRYILNATHRRWNRESGWKYHAHDQQIQEQLADMEQYFHEEQLWRKKVGKKVYGQKN